LLAFRIAAAEVSQSCGFDYNGLDSESPNRGHREYSNGLLEHRTLASDAVVYFASTSTHRSVACCRMGRIRMGQALARGLPLARSHSNVAGLCLARSHSNVAGLLHIFFSLHLFACWNCSAPAYPVAPPLPSELTTRCCLFAVVHGGSGVVGQHGRAARRGTMTEVEHGGPTTLEGSAAAVVGGERDGRRREARQPTSEGNAAAEGGKRGDRWQRGARWPKKGSAAAEKGKRGGPTSQERSSLEEKRRGSRGFRINERWVLVS
jgi:hypothetical protein